MPFTNSDGLRIHFEVRGDGPPLVLAHGWGANTESNWNRPGWTDRLAVDHRVIGVDIRGHGRSDKPREPSRYGYGDMATDLIAVLDELDLAEASFLGYSLGAFSITHLLGHHRERVTAAVLIGIGDETDASIATADTIATTLRATSIRVIEDPVQRAYRHYAEADPSNDLEALAASALGMWPDGFPRRIGGAGLAHCDAPVLVLNGADDLPYVLTDEALVAVMPGASLIRIPGCDHLAGVHDERFRDATVTFLNR